MMDTPLLISSILRHADRNYGDREIVSVTADNPLHRYTYADCFRRARQLANALDKLGLSQGDRVATVAWNDYRHLEAYYGIGGAGYICHTINPRLFPEQVVFIITMRICRRPASRMQFLMSHLSVTKAVHTTGRKLMKMPQ